MFSLQVPSILIVLVIWIAGTSPSHGQRYHRSFQNPNSFNNRVSVPYYKPGLKSLSSVGGVYGLLSLGLPSHVARSPRAGYTPQGYPSGSNVNPYQVQVQVQNQNRARPGSYVPVNPNRYQPSGNFPRKTSVNVYKPGPTAPHLDLLLAAKARIGGGRNYQSPYQHNTGYPVSGRQYAPRSGRVAPVTGTGRVVGSRYPPSDSVSLTNLHNYNPASQPTFSTRSGYPQQPAYPAPRQPTYGAQPAQRPTYPAQPGYPQQPALPAPQQPTYGAQPAQQPTYPAQPGYPQQPAPRAPQQPTYGAQPAQQPTYPAQAAQQPTYPVQTAQQPNEQPEYPLVARQQTGYRPQEPTHPQNSYHPELATYPAQQSYQPQQPEYHVAANSQPRVHTGSLPRSNQCFNNYMDQLRSYGFGFDKLGYPGDLIQKEITAQSTLPGQIFTPSSQTYPSPDRHGMCNADRKILTKISHNGGVCYLIQPDTQNVQVYMCRSREFPYGGPSQGINKCVEKYADREVAAYCDGTGTGNKILKLKVRLPVGCGPKMYSC
ncbi:adhesive plaque matrix protein-like [Haliotis rufescens]|uniref:adhesive plaque matrix protein-like n=1 Tax=Haliotis rufescens TaxID=6454 RepID=UPI00201F6BAD|nr:adhesive plaque matrix protein-like [Haliotis rufescens]